jgi:integrase
VRLERAPDQRRDGKAKCEPPLRCQSAQNGADRRWADPAGCGASPLTIESYRSIVRQFNTWHVDVHGRKPQIGAFDRSLLGEYMSHLSKAGKAPSTINKARGHLVALWNWAHIEGLHPEKPSNVAKVKEPKRSPEAWTLEQLGNILKSAGECEGMVGEVPANVLFPTMIWTAFNSGARVSAMMSIRWHDVDLEGGWLKIRAEYQKHKEDQQVGLMPETIELLQRLAEYPRADETVFGVWRSDRTRHGWKRLNAALRKILKRAGLPHGQGVEMPGFTRHATAVDWVR